jgi:hypothetical protein
MLTKTDLQAIENIFDRKFDEKFEEKFEEKFDKKFDEKFEEKIAPLRKIMNQINKKFDLFVDYFDEKTIDHEKRIHSLEQKVFV